jgi:hypothetical protein
MSVELCHFYEMTKFRTCSSIELLGKIPIFAKSQNGPSVLFQSMSACVEAGYASNIQNVRRKIKRGEQGWRYAALDSSGKPVRTPYVLKEGEISYEMLSQ